MRKKKDIVYEKDLGLDFGLSDMVEPMEDDEETPAEDEYQPDMVPVSESEYDDAPPTYPVSPDRSADRIRMEELEGKVAQLEGKIDRIVTILERISEIYGKTNSSH